MGQLNLADMGGDRDNVAAGRPSCVGMLPKVIPSPPIAVKYAVAAPAEAATAPMA